MEEILELYERPAENARPLVCFDEKSVELHAEVSIFTGNRPAIFTHARPANPTVAE